MISQSEPKTEPYERERIILEIIKENPNLHHNGLIKKIVPMHMAKTTFEKTKDSLLEKEIIYVKKQGNMKFYLIVGNYEEKFQHRIERKTNDSFHDLKLQIKRLDSDYSHKDIDEKIQLANSLLKNLVLSDNGFTLLDSFKNQKKTLYRDEHLEIQQLIFHVFKIIRKDDDFKIIFPAIVGNLESFTP
jgi:hypothetical protein